MPHVTLISHSELFYSTRRLLEAGTALGYTMQRVDPIRVTIESGPGGARVVEDGVEVPPPDVVIPRVGATLQPWTLAMLDTWVGRGARCAFTSDALAVAADKLRCQQALQRAGLPVVPTVAVRELVHIEDALRALPAERWVLKLRQGTGGSSVVLASDRAGARSMIGALIKQGETVLVQPFIPTSPIRDLRVLVANSQVLASCWRHAADGEFRANVHRGGATFAADLSPATERLALAAARAVGLPFSGVDLLETGDGFAVLEVNGSPGLEGIEAATGRDLATGYIQSFVTSVLS